MPIINAHTLIPLGGLMGDLIWRGTKCLPHICISVKDCWQLNFQNIYKSRCCMWSSVLLSVFCLWRTESSICFGFASLSGSFPVEDQLEWLVEEVCGAKSCLLFIKALATCPPSSQTTENWKVIWEARSTKWENICKQRNWKLRKCLQTKKLKFKSNLRSTTWENICKQRNWCFSRGWGT